jgi:hypothetical protein
MFDSLIDDLININFDTSFTSTITQTATAYTAGTTNIYSTIVYPFMKDVSFAIGASLLCIFMMIELVSIVQRSDGGSGLHSMQIPANILIKWGIYTFLFCRLTLVLDGIQSITVQMVTADLARADGVALRGTVADAKQALASLNLFEKANAYTLLVIIWLVSNLLKSLLSFTMIFRIFELWIMLMFAPIPLATLPSPEFRQTAFNFLKSFTAICLSGVIIVAAYKLYGVFMANWFSTLEFGTTLFGFIKCLIQVVIYLGVLVATAFNSGKLAKSILNAV